MPAPVIETFPELGLAHLRLENRQGLKSAYPLKPTSVYIVSVVLSSHLISVVPVYTIAYSIGHSITSETILSCRFQYHQCLNIVMLLLVKSSFLLMTPSM